jgi:hypothetical protein
MPLTTGRRKVPLGLQGEAELLTALVCCDGCGHKAAGAEADTLDKVRARAVRKALDEGFVAHDKGKRWLCSACRLRGLPEHLQQLFPRLLAGHGLTADGDKASPGRRARRKKSPPPNPPTGG